MHRSHYISLLLLALFVIGCNQMNSKMLSREEEESGFKDRLLSAIGTPPTEEALMSYLLDNDIDYSLVDVGGEMFDIEQQQSDAEDVNKICMWNEKADEKKSLLASGVKSFGVRAYINSSGDVVDILVTVFYPNL